MASIFHNPFGLPSWPSFLHRVLLTLLASPKYFFSAFGWEGFALLATDYLGLSTESAEYYVLAGIGAFLGLLISSIAIILALQLKGEDYTYQMHNSILVSLASGMTTGSLWQISVNVSIEEGFSFTEAFFFVFAISAASYFACTCVIRGANGLLPAAYRLHILPMTRIVIWYDIIQSLCSGSADAFFLGTDDTEFADGWLIAFNVSGETVFVSMCLAGASGLVGYVVFQMLENLVLQDGWIWVDQESHHRKEIIRESESSDEDDGSPEENHSFLP